MTALALLAIGSLALWMVVAIVGAQLLRRRRRRDMGLPLLESDWRDSAPKWSNPRYYDVRRRP